MPIDTIPLLAEDYPLFDWDDHPQSYYALGEGELVSGFQKETWNAIIDKTLAALSAAGMNWDSKYTTAAKAKITEAYGPLSATMFNSVRHNIDRPAPVGWGWANNPNLRGYVGREDFKGYADYGLNGDLFYAEYLLEMVRRLNLLLSIMKGTANIKEMDGPILSRTESVHDLLALPSAPMAFSEPAFSSYISGLMARRAGQFAFMGKAATTDEATVRKFLSRPMISGVKVYSLQRSKMQMPVAARLALYGESVPSIHQAVMDVFNALYLSSGHGLSETSSRTVISLPEPVRVQVEERSNAQVSAVPTALAPLPVTAAQVAETGTDATIQASPAAYPVGTEMAKTAVDITFEKIRPRRMSGKVMSGVTCVAVLDSAWLAPIWVNGKLYIRQAYETITNDTTLEVK